MTAKTNLTINPQRLWDSLMETAAFGGTPKGGIKRLTVSDEDKRVRDWFKMECEKLGCTVEVDEVGNMFATRPGKRKNLAPLNSDYDLYSMGKDGASQSSLMAKVSRDDVVRALDGRFMGRASDLDR